MAYFDCIVGGSGKGNTLVVTCADDLAGATITCTNGTKTYTKTCPSTAPYEVTFYGLEAGTWTLSATVSGNTYTATVVITDCAALLGGFNWRTWVDTASQLDSSDYDSLDEVLADELAVRELCLEHACVDYMASVAASNEDLETVINNDYCAKWINLSDYALDFLGANTVIKALMDEADKYGYGEWVITDDTTTPPTWGAKGNVPVMTSNSAPYGTASASNQNANAYQAFNGSDSGYDGGSSAYSGTITYAFTNPICPSKVSFRNNTNTDGNVRIYTYKVEGYDGTSWEDLTETLSVSDRVTVGALTEAEISTTKYYTQLRLNMLSGSQYIGCAHLQFYGRELSVSVPKMDTNTTPYGTVSATSEYNSTYGACKAFDNDASTWWAASTTGTSGTNQFLAYEFPHKVCPKKARIKFDNLVTSATYKIEGSNDRFVSDINEIGAGTALDGFIDLNNISEYKSLRAYIVSQTLNTTAALGRILTLQFYGLDYSEREFEQGTTKKWLYDHGMTPSGNFTISCAQPTLSTIDIGYDELFIKMTGNGNSNVVRKSIDLSNYSLMRAKIGHRLGSSDQYGEGFVVLTPNTVTEEATLVVVNSVNNPNTFLALDVSSFSTLKDVAFDNGGNVTVARYCSLTEWWLE